jgi:hypothetical protein
MKRIQSTSQCQQLTSTQVEKHPNTTVQWNGPTIDNGRSPVRLHLGASASNIARFKQALVELHRLANIRASQPPPLVLPRPTRTKIVLDTIITVPHEPLVIVQSNPLLSPRAALHPRCGLRSRLRQFSLVSLGDLRHYYTRMGREGRLLTAFFSKVGGGCILTPSRIHIVNLRYRLQLD